jgi:hypothetical protein
MWNDKPDGYPIPVRNPTGMGTGMNFYPWVQVWVQISTRSLFADERVIALPDPNPTRCHPYVCFDPKDPCIPPRLRVEGWHPSSRVAFHLPEGVGLWPQPIAPTRTSAWLCGQLGPVWRWTSKFEPRTAFRFRTGASPIINLQVPLSRGATREATSAVASVISQRTHFKTACSCRSSLVRRVWYVYVRTRTDATAVRSSRRG